MRRGAAHCGNLSKDAALGPASKRIHQAFGGGVRSLQRLPEVNYITNGCNQPRAEATAAGRRGHLLQRTCWTSLSIRQPRMRAVADVAAAAVARAFSPLSHLLIA